MPPNTCGSGSSANSNSVTTPKLPQPPRSAQNSSVRPPPRRPPHRRSRAPPVPTPADRASARARPSGGQAHHPASTRPRRSYQTCLPASSAPGRPAARPRRATSRRHPPPPGPDRGRPTPRAADADRRPCRRRTSNAPPRCGPATDSGRKAPLLRERHRRHDVLHARRTRDDRRPAIEQRVERCASGVIAGVGLVQHRTAVPQLEIAEFRSHAHRRTLQEQTTHTNGHRIPSRRRAWWPGRWSDELERPVGARADPILPDLEQ